MTSGLSRLLAVLVGAMFCACATPTDGGPAQPSSRWVPDYRDSDKEFVVLCFFSMSCRACQSMGPHMGELYELVRQRGLSSKIDFYAYGTKASPMECYQFAQRYKAPYPVIADYNRAISKRFGRFRLPQMIVFQRRDGTLVEKTRLRYPRGDKEKLLEKILH